MNMILKYLFFIYLSVYVTVGVGKEAVHVHEMTIEAGRRWWIPWNCDSIFLFSQLIFKNIYSSFSPFCVWGVFNQQV